MIPDQKRNHGDEQNKARQRWKQNEIMCWDSEMLLPVFLGMVQTWQAGRSVVQAYYEGARDLSFFFPPVDQCYCVQMKIVLSLRRPDQLSSKLPNWAELQKGNSFWCFADVQVHASPRLGTAEDIQESVHERELILL